MTSPRSLRVVSVLLSIAAGCGGRVLGPAGPHAPYTGPPPLGAPISPAEGSSIDDAAGAPTGWRWIPFDDAVCVTATTTASGSYRFGTSPTGLAISWGDPGNATLVVFLQGGGACWDFASCGGFKSLGLDKTASTGPFGPAEFVAGVWGRYPDSWVHRDKLPVALAGATIAFVPYCTGDVHGGARVTTYTPPRWISLPSVTWSHVGHSNVLAFLKRLGATFPAPARLVVAGSSAGGFGALANYPAFRWYWPTSTAWLVDDSGPPLVGSAVPEPSRAAWYAAWDLGASLDPFCPGCPADISQALAEVEALYPDDRIALVSHLQDSVIRTFFGSVQGSPPTFAPMPAATFEAELRRLGTLVMDPATPNAKYLFTNTPTPTTHPALDAPSTVTTPGAGLRPWLEQMFSGDPAWASASD
ncbi:MAG TPA: hypothetical protein VLT47_10405 [Anaeromyxobacteraceae bacterium]|nr:hypothetical protein [Anaeromyxobacteraceae bacterium]